MPKWRPCPKHCPCKSDGLSSTIVNYYVLPPHEHGPEGFTAENVCPYCIGEAWERGEVTLDVRNSDSDS